MLGIPLLPVPLDEDFVLLLLPLVILATSEVASLAPVVLAGSSAAGAEAAKFSFRGAGRPRVVVEALRGRV